MSIRKLVNRLQTESSPKDLQSRVERIERVIRGIASFPDPWIDLKTACVMKGIPYNSVARPEKRWMQPNGGKADGIVSGRPRWRPETIREWIFLDDQELKRRYKKEATNAITR